MKRLLVTTAQEDSWNVSEPTIFLGEWCKKSNRQHVWSSIDSEVVRPYGLDPKQRILDTDEMHKLYDTLIRELSVKLNDFHNKNYSVRYWTILIGPWLGSFVMVVMNRYKALEVAIDNFDISKTILINQKGFSLTKNDYSDFREAINSDLWNNALYVEILKNIKNIKSQNIEILIKNTKSANFSNHKNIKFNFKSSLKKSALRVSNFLQFLSRNTDAFIVNSYLPIIDEIKLKLLLGQFPIIWKSPKIDSNYFRDVELNRNDFLLEFQNFNGIERELKRLINKLIPKIYIEGYEFMCREANNLKWPSNPKFIFTSNNFTADELFKFWVGLKVEEGASYYVGQHGANYGTSYESKNWTELNTADRFYSWGWKDMYKDVNTIPAFNFKIINNLNCRYKKNGKLLLVERSPGTRDGPRDRFYESLIVHEGMVELYKLLHTTIQQKSLVRLHHRSTTLTSWQQKYKPINIDSGKGGFNKLISQSRLVVFNYDSAGLLELLAMNVPVICFWKGGFSHLLPVSKKYYDLLKDSGIFYDNSEKVANHINLHWEDVDSWWLSPEVQSARLEFCKQYSRVIDNPIVSLKKLLVD
jgi:putative transferase (TIGR04331 family)